MDSIELINFTKLSKDQLLYILEKRNSDDIRKYMDNDQIISEQEHLDFCKRLVHSTSSLYFLVKYNNEPCGVYTINKINPQDNSATVGSYFFDGPGILPTLTSEVIQLVFDKKNIKKLFLYVKKSNEKAIFFNIFKMKAEIINEDDKYIYFCINVEKFNDSCREKLKNHTYKVIL